MMSMADGKKSVRVCINACRTSAHIHQERKVLYMFIANNWKDYEVIDTSEGEKLERWGTYLLVRPDPQVIWNTPKKKKAGVK